LPPSSKLPELSGSENFGKKERGSFWSSEFGVERSTKEAIESKSLVGEKE